MTVEFVKELEGFAGEACLVEKDGQHYVVSSVDSAFDTGQPETLVFEADAEGNVERYTMVTGGQHVSRAQAIFMLDQGVKGKQPGFLGELLDLFESQEDWDV
jgi:hypothetical protein